MCCLSQSASLLPWFPHNLPGLLGMVFQAFFKLIWFYYHFPEIPPWLREYIDAPFGCKKDTEIQVCACVVCDAKSVIEH